MRKTSLLFFINCCCAVGNAQSVADILQQVKKSQQNLQYASYTLTRTDTLVTGHIRQFTGNVKLQVVPSDTHFGFRFWGVRNDVKRESIYDGRNCFDINHQTKKYEVESRADMIEHFLGSPGGQVVLTDLVRIDTTGATSLSISQDATYYYLLMSLADLTQYDVIKRTKKIIIDKKLLLPIGIISHQETLGKVQDLNFMIQSIKIDDAAEKYDFSSARFPEGYAPGERGERRKTSVLQNKTAPPFTLTSFDGQTISSKQFAGKLVLLDFWEVWCGPCIESMPKVQQWHEKYQSKGLEVYGIIHEKEYLASAKQLVQKRKIGFPMLIGDENTKETYGVSLVPIYILINKEGKIIMVSEGFSPLLEVEIQKNL